MKPKVCVLRTDGTNCDTETAYAFNKVGGDAEIVHINSLKKGPGASRGGRAYRGQGYPAGETGILHLLKGGSSRKTHLYLRLK